MKQYWRIGTIRATLALAMGMFSLGKVYYKDIPFLFEMGVVGALIMGTILVLAFLGVGWLYDEKAKLWNEQIQVQTERSVYQYIPNYKNYGFDYPVLLLSNSACSD
jgi:hypothetical protein